MKATALLTVLVALLVPVAGCARVPATPTATLPASPSPGGAAATVNGRPIAMAAYEAQLQTAMASFQPGVDPQSAEGQAAITSLRRQVLEWLIDQTIIDQAAGREGIVVDDAQVTAEVERIRSENSQGFAEWLAANGFTEETFRLQTRSDLLGAAIRDRVTAHIRSPMEQAHLRQILVESEAAARALAERIAQGKASFEEVARAESNDEAGRAQGGDIGFVPRGLLPSSVEQVAFALQPGQVGSPVQSPYGWHLVQMVERDPAREVPPEMLATLREEAFMRWLEAERAKVTIERFVQ